MSMLDVTFENGSCVNECNLKELRGALENACMEKNCSTTRFALIKNDNELCRFNAHPYSYASDLTAFMREVDDELDESQLAVVLEVREDVPVWIWVLRNV